MSEIVNIEDDNIKVIVSNNNTVLSDDTDNVVSYDNTEVSIPNSTGTVYYDNSNPAGEQYGKQGDLPSFRIKNLFNELTDDWQRTMARYNLGIASEYSMVWGNMEGSVTDQTDLINYISNIISSTIASSVTPLSTLIASNYNALNDLIGYKANIDSPVFTGSPQSTTPSDGDYSKNIATTKFVMDAITNASGNTLKYFYVNPTNITQTSDITVTWDYYNPITSQTINGTTLTTDIRNYTFSSVSSSLTIELSYVIGGTTYVKTSTVEYVTPIYYGKSSTYVNDTKTTSTSFTITLNSNEYLYIFVSGSKDIYCDGILGGFIDEGTVLINGATYTEYRTTNSNLGKINITLC